MDAYAIISTLALALGVGWCSGVNLYATIAVLGALHRFTGFELPEGMEVLASDWVLWPAVLLYTIEFFADKIPGLDTAWDSVQTFLRIPAGAVLAAMALGDVPLELQMMAGLVGGSLALGSHSIKMGTRLAAHGTGASPVVSPVASVVEDLTVVGTIGLIVANPILALGILAALIVATYFALVLVWKTIRAFIQSFNKPSETPA